MRDSITCGKTFRNALAVGPVGLAAVGLAAASLGTIGLTAASASANQLNVFNWSDYIAADTIERFEAETGISVNYDVYDSNSVVEARMMAGGAGYDIVVPTAVPYFNRQVEAGIYQPLDRDLIPNLANLDPDLMARVPQQDYGVIYMWGTNGLGYNREAIEERMPDAPLSSLDLIFDPDVVSNFADCGVTMLDDAAEVIPMLLNYLGHEPYGEDLDALQEAEDRLMELRQHVRYFHSSQYINDLANGEICLAIGWSGDVFQARDRAEEAGQDFTIGYTIPDEGTVLWFDILAIPEDAPNPEAAHAFINFILEPDVIADITDYVVYANAVPASRDLMDPEISNDPAVFPPDEVQDRLFSAEAVSPAYERARTRTWTRVRTGQ
jgi:putrescine transport system substrate-binding protein